MLQSITQKLMPLLAAPVFRNTTNFLGGAYISKGFHLISSAPVVSASKQLDLVPSSTSFLCPAIPLVTQVAGFKVKGRLRRRCKDCYFVMRQERLYVICKTHPRHKQMAMKARDYKSWILTHATQSKVRPY